MEIIKNHKNLASHIEGKKILHLNSFGKDSAVCLEWLTNFAKPSKVVALNFKYLANHFGDSDYLEYQKKKYPEVEFIEEPNPLEISSMINGLYQCPIQKIAFYNDFEYTDFELLKYAREVAKIYECDFICSGMSKYESVSRATAFHKKGILQGDMIYPLGMMQKSEIFSIIKHFKIKLHPCYKFNESGIDHPSYYKMRASFIANPEYKKRVYKFFPMLKLDEYRYEKLFKGNKK